MGYFIGYSSPFWLDHYLFDLYDCPSQGSAPFSRQKPPSPRNRIFTTPPSPENAWRQVVRRAGSGRQPGPNGADTAGLPSPLNTQSVPATVVMIRCAFKLVLSPIRMVASTRNVPGLGEGLPRQAMLLWKHCRHPRQTAVVASHGYVLPQAGSFRNRPRWNAPGWPLPGAYEPCGTCVRNLTWQIGD